MTTTTSNVVLKLPNLSHNTVSVGFLGPKPLHLSSLLSNFRTKLKLQSFSISRPTHFKVSQNSITTTEESLSSLTENDLLIVGPGVLGRLVAKKWRQVLFSCSFIFIFIMIYYWHCDYSCRKFRVVKFMDRQ